METDIYKDYRRRGLEGAAAVARGFQVLEFSFVGFRSEGAVDLLLAFGFRV